MMRRWMAIPALVGTILLAGVVISTADVNEENKTLSKSETIGSPAGDVHADVYKYDLVLNDFLREVVKVK
jgi:hypothetical protein